MGRMIPDVQTAFQRLPRRVRRFVRPFLRLQTSRTAVKKLRLGQSRIGGIPDVPERFQWPRYEGHSLAFIAQIDLAEVARFPEVLAVPKTGSLLFFYDCERQPWGYDPKHRGSAAVIYVPDAPGQLVRRPLPSDVSEAGRFESCSLKFRLECFHSDEGLPSHDDPVWNDSQWLKELSSLHAFLDSCKSAKGPRHGLGGYAAVVQGGSMELECQLVTHGLYCGNETGYKNPRAANLAPGAADWQLLLQLDEDENPGMTWIDAGLIYYWIRRQDLEARRFEYSWLLLKCT